jgi:hypothetical protein
MTNLNRPVEILVARSFWLELIRIVGLIASIYLVGYSSFLIVLAVGFSPPFNSAFVESVGTVSKYSIPAIFYLCVGVAAFTLLGSRRFWTFGLLATLVQTAMAVYAHVRPGSLPPFTDWLV